MKGGSHSSRHSASARACSRAMASIMESPQRLQRGRTKRRLELFTVAADEARQSLRGPAGRAHDDGPACAVRQFEVDRQWLLDALDLADQPAVGAILVA